MSVLFDHNTSKGVLYGFEHILLLHAAMLLQTVMVTVAFKLTIAIISMVLTLCMVNMLHVGMAKCRDWDLSVVFVFCD